MTNLLRWLSVACAVFAVCSAQAADDPSAATVRSAKILVENKEYDSAKQLLQPIVLKGQPSAEAAYLLAVCEEKLGNKKPALDGYKRALTIMQSDPEQVTDQLKEMASAAVDRLDAARQVLLNAAKQLEEEAAKLQADNPTAAIAIRAAARGLVAPAAAEPQKRLAHPAAAVRFRNHWYQLFDEDVTWHMARQRSQEKGGYLVSITSPEEDSFVRELSKGQNVWLGASDEAAEGIWRWDSGELFSYKNWTDKEPDNSQGAQNHAFYWVGRGWADNFAGARTKYICEWEK